MNEPLQGEEYTDFIRRIRPGDERAAEELIRRYEPEIRLEIRTLLRLRDPRLRRVFDSMDICQSVMASFFLRAAVGDFDLDEPSQLVRLLVGMARNRLAEQRPVPPAASPRRPPDRRERPGGMDDPGGVGEPERGDLPAGAARDVPRRLTGEEQQVAELRSQGHDWAAVARELGGTAEGRRKQLARAVARVGQELGLDTVAGSRLAARTLSGRPPDGNGIMELCRPRRDRVPCPSGSITSMTRPGSCSNDWAGWRTDREAGHGPERPSLSGPCLDLRDGSLWPADASEEKLVDWLCADQIRGWQIGPAHPRRGLPALHPASGGGGGVRGGL